MINEIKLEAKRLNDKYFESNIELEGIVFTVSARMTRTLGRFSYIKDSRGNTISRAIKMSSLIMSTSLWKQTLLHELVHAWQFQTYGDCDHGHTFKQKATQIHRLNPKMVITRILNNDEVSKAAASRLGNTTQFMAILKDPKKCIFFRKLTQAQIATLQRRGLTIKKTGTPLPIRHCRSFDSYMTKGATGYYPTVHAKLNFSKFVAV